MAGQLFVVATPIGNLDDMTFRAVQVLKSVKLIAAEDTRQSLPLLKHYQIDTPLTACHDHNESQKTQQLIDKLLAGDDIALISDAGTPLISDPGFKLVRSAQQQGIRVIPIAGACAAIAGLSAVGLPSDKFSFQGFLPAKSSQRQKQLMELKQETQTLIFYEAPHRIVDCLSDMVEIFGQQRLAGFAREITKTFETIKQLPLGELLAFVKNDSNQQKGEIVLIIDGAEAQPEVENAELDKLLQRLLQDVSVKVASQLASDILGVKKKIAYQRALELENG